MDYGSSFTREDLAPHSSNSVFDAKGSGVKLIVVYRGPTLVPGQVITSPPPSNDRRFYQADHVYHTPAAPALWQAVVTAASWKAMVSTSSTIRPRWTSCQPAPRRRYKAAATTERGAPAIAGGNLLSAVDSSVTHALLFPHYELGYAVINGRQQPGALYDARIRQVIGATTPRLYDIQLVSERPQQITAQLDQATELVTTFSNQEALALWNITVPPGANNRVDVLFTGVTTGPGDYYHTGSFGGRLFLGNGGGLIPPDNDQFTFALKENGVSTYGLRRLESITFPRKGGPSASNIGLALTYGDLPEAEDGVYDLSDHDSRHFVSCRQLPTSDGGCQEVKCPVVGTNMDAAGLPTPRRTGAVELCPWVQIGPGSASTFYPAIAPLIGTPNISSSPTVAVVDGIVKYIGGNVRVDAPAVPTRQFS